MEVENLTDSGNGSDEEHKIEKHPLVPQLLKALRHKFGRKINSTTYWNPSFYVKSYEEVGKEWIIMSLGLHSNPHGYQSSKIIYWNIELNTIHEYKQDKAYYDFEYLGIFREDFKKEYRIMEKRQHIEECFQKYYQCALSCHLHNFYRFIEKVFEGEFIYSGAEKTWYCLQNGKWKIHKNNSENFILSMMLKNYLPPFYEQYKIVHKKARDAVIKKNLVGGLTFKEGSVNHSGIYKRGKIFRGKEEVESEKTIDKIEAESGNKVMSEYYQNKLMDSNNFVPNAVKALREHFFKDRVEFDNSPHILCFDNCYIDLDIQMKKKKLIPFPHNKNNFITKSTNGNLMKKIKVKQYIEHLEYTFKRSFTSTSKYDTMLKASAYCLYGENPLKLVVMNVGKEGDNGKGVRDTLFEKTLGDYYGAMKSNFFVSKTGNFDSERPQPELSKTMRLRYVSVSEMPQGSKLCGEAIKTVRGGNKIPTRKLHQDTEYMTTEATYNMDTNHFQDFGDQGSAVDKSIFTIFWDVTFKDKDELPDGETQTEKERSEIKKEITDDKNYFFGSAWIHILLDNLTLKFENHEEFKEQKVEELESVNYYKQYFEDEITNTIKLDGDNIEFNYLMLTKVYQHATGWYRNQNMVITSRKIFIQEFEKCIENKEQIQNEKTPRKLWDGKSARKYYKHFQFTSELEKQDSPH